MKSFKRKYLVSVGLFLLVAAAFLSGLFLHNLINYINPKEPEAEEWDNSYNFYSDDSCYYFVVDSTIRVWNAKTHRKISEFDVGNDEYGNTMNVKDLAFHPNGKDLAILNNLNILTVWDIKEGDCIINNDEYCYQHLWVYFTDDGKYLLLIDHRDPEVNVLRWPDLNLLGFAYLGSYRNDFSWEYVNGKIEFCYEEDDGFIYKTVFPEDEHADSLVFSEPQREGMVVEDTTGY